MCATIAYCAKKINSMFTTPHNRRSKACAAASCSTWTSGCCCCCCWPSHWELLRAYTSLLFKWSFYSLVSHTYATAFYHIMIIAFDWLWKKPRHASYSCYANNLLHSYGVCCNALPISNFLMNKPNVKNMFDSCTRSSKQLSTPSLVESPGLQKWNIMN